MTTTTDLVILGAASYEARVTPLKTGGRIDVEVAPTDPDAPRAFGDTNIIDQLRRFFSALEAEAHEHRGDPVATGQALARVEALLADMRSVRDSLKSLTASALNDSRVRRLTIAGVTTLEGTTEIKRSNWEHAALLTRCLDARGFRLLATETGEVLPSEDAASVILELLRPEWKLTPLRALGINPDDYCSVESEDDGTPVRTPSVRIVDNLARRSEVVK